MWRTSRCFLEFPEEEREKYECTVNGEKNHSTDFQQETFVGIILAVPYLPEGSNAAYGAVGRAVGSMQSDLPMEDVDVLFQCMLFDQIEMGGWEGVRAF